VRQHRPHALRSTYFPVAILSVDVIYWELPMAASWYFLSFAWWMAMHFLAWKRIFPLHGHISLPCLTWWIVIGMFIFIILVGSCVEFNSVI
jgi:hypothetical protein